MKNFSRIEPTITQTVGGKFKREIVIKRFKTDDGLVHEFTTYNKENTQCVAIIALTPDNKVVVVKQFRPGREYHCFDIPGGAVESGEDLEEAVRRELAEETGYTADSIKSIGKFSWNSDNNITAYYFLAHDCTPNLERSMDDNEMAQGAEVELISIDQLMENAKTDMMSDPVAVLQAYDILNDLRTGKE